MQNNFKKSSSPGARGLRDIIAHDHYADACQQAGLPVSVAESLIARALAGLMPATNPSIVHMVGLPASGKSTFAAQYTMTNTLKLDFDGIMQSIPNYGADIKALGAEKAFNNWTLCARAIGYETLFRATEAGLNIFMDHGGARPDHLEMVKFLKEQEGYTVKIVAICISEKLAFARAATRERHLPPELIPERKKALDLLLPQYRLVADEYSEYKATQAGNVLIIPPQPKPAAQKPEKPKNPGDPAI